MSLTDRRPQIDLVIFPEALMARELAALLRPLGVSIGLQDVSAFDEGAFTGETPASHAAQACIRFAEIGHAERRRDFGETDALVARKVAAAVDAGLIPFVCVGEPARGSVAEASDYCLRQLQAPLGAAARSPLVIAYEPVWAIGAPHPAPTAHVRDVASRLRAALDRHPRARIVYGGSAGPGLYGPLSDAVDGLFLGRFAHDVSNLEATLAELRPATNQEGSATP